MQDILETLNTQIGSTDILVTIKICLPNQKMVFLHKRWDLKKSPFWRSEIEPKPSTAQHSFPYYPHTGDMSQVIWIQSKQMLIGFISEKTHQTPALIYVQAEQGLNISRKDGTPFYPDISQTELVEILLKDGWCQ